MAINRGTRKAIFVHLVETFTMLGTLGGAGWGVFQTLGGNPFEILMSAIRTGMLGFIGGTLVGLLLGVLTVIYLTIFD